MFYLSSNSIKIFPLAKNRTVDAGARRLYESNIANIIRQLIDTNGFIIHQPNNLQHTEWHQSGITPVVTFDLEGLEFNLYGYYVSVDGEAKVTIPYSDKDTALYASLVIDNNEVSGQDEGGNESCYTGITFTTTEPAKNDCTASIKLFDVKEDGNNYKLVPAEDAIKKFDATSLIITQIDGKH